MRKIHVFGDIMDIEEPFISIGVPSRLDKNYEEEYNKRRAKILYYQDGIDVDKIKDASDLVKLLDEKKAIFKICRYESNPKEDEEIRNDLNEYGLGDYEFRVRVRYG